MMFMCCAKASLLWFIHRRRVGWKITVDSLGLSISLTKAFFPCIHSNGAVLNYFKVSAVRRAYCFCLLSLFFVFFSKWMKSLHTVLGELLQLTYAFSMQFLHCTNRGRCTVCKHTLTCKYKQSSHSFDFHFSVNSKSAAELLLRLNGSVLRFNKLSSVARLVREAIIILRILVCQIRTRFTKENVYLMWLWTTHSHRCIIHCMFFIQSFIQLHLIHFEHLYFVII